MSSNNSNEDVKSAHGNLSLSNIESRVIHAGQSFDPVSGAVVCPITLASTFAQPSPGKMISGYEYGRTNNPTRNAFERCIADLEHCKYGHAFASGSAACACLIGMLDSGDHVVSIDDVYGGTNRFFNRVATPNSNMNFSMIDMSNVDNIESYITDKTKMIWIESPTNPTLKITDIRAVCNIKSKYPNIIIVVDNTFASPYNQNPIDLGADIVLHSVSKYINGHSDVIMGILTTNNKELADKIHFLQNAIGGIPSPFDCYMALRGVKTLAVRMDRHNSNALAVARFLSSHQAVEKVIYPGLESHPQHLIAKKQMRGFSGMVSVFIKGGLNESRKFLEHLKIFTLAESLGCVESLAEHPAIMTHAAVPSEQRKKLGIHDNFVRLSVGIEHIDDIINDLNQALIASQN